MKTKQHTIQSKVTVSGVGLHTGKPCKMTFMPAAPNHGICFQRIDLEDEPIIEADVDHVVDCSRGTTLAKGDARVHTVEHTLAALVGLEIDNVLIQLDGPEPPIMDGSSIKFVEALMQAGLEEQNMPRNFIELEEGVFYQDPENNIEIAALPLNDYRVTVMVDYNSPFLGSQYATLNDIGQFVDQFAQCRTFCFFHEIEELFNQNLIQGGNLDSAIVIMDRAVSQEELHRIGGLFHKKDLSVQKEGILNNVELHFKNEPARHKLLDVMGDLALLGRPLKAQIMAARPGHRSNVNFAKKIRKIVLKNERSKVPQYDPKASPVLDSVQIANILPHRFPFLLIDKIMYLDDKSVEGMKNVTMNETFFQGHFPGNPVMPGVLQLEAMAQTGAIFLLNTVPDPENYWTYFLGIDTCRFKRTVVPGDTLIFRCELAAPIKRGIVKMKGEAYVAGNLVCEAIVTASLVKKS